MATPTEVLSEGQARALDARGEDWLTKQQAADYLGVSTRTIQTMCAEGKLRKLERQSAEGRVTIISREDVEREKRSREPSHSMILPPPISTEVAEGLAQKVPALVDVIAAAIRPAAPPMNYTLDQAAKASGLPRRLLVHAIKSGRLRAHRWSKEYFVHREDLEAFRPEVEESLG
jgi:excisionase family DNA binding protein